VRIQKTEYRMSNDEGRLPRRCAPRNDNWAVKWWGVRRSQRSKCKRQNHRAKCKMFWIPACAGMTKGEPRVKRGENPTKAKKHTESRRAALFVQALIFWVLPNNG